MQNGSHFNQTWFWLRKLLVTWFKELKIQTQNIPRRSQAMLRKSSAIIKNINYTFNLDLPWWYSAQYWQQVRALMTSSNGNIFRVTGPLWGESTSHRASGVELWYFRWSAPEQRDDRTIETGDLRHHRAHYDVTVMVRSWNRVIGCLLVWSLTSTEVPSSYICGCRAVRDTPLNYTSVWWQSIALRWRHNGHDSVSNHQPHDCLLTRLFRRRSNKTS